MTDHIILHYFLSYKSGKRIKFAIPYPNQVKKIMAVLQEICNLHRSKIKQNMDNRKII